MVHLKDQPILLLPMLRWRDTVSNSLKLGLINPRSHDIYHWVELTIMERHPLDFCERPYTHSNAEMASISANTLEKYMRLLYGYVRGKLIETLHQTRSWQQC